MADTKGNDPKSGPDQPAATKSSAVKPPVLDLTARETKPEPAKPASGGSETVPPAATRFEPKPGSADKSASTVPPVPPKPPQRPDAVAPDRPFAWGATVAGGVIGLAAAYGLALAGWWPAAPTSVPAADPRLAQFASAIPELETVTQTTQSELAALNQRIGALETATPATSTAAPAADLSALQADIAALGERVDAVSASTTGAGEPDAQLTTQLATLTSQLGELGARLGTAEADLRTLDTAVSEASETLASQPGDIGAVLQLPLVLSGLETAFASGRPYETELAALRAASPEAAIPTAIANAASAGLARPDAIAQRFAEVLPAIIAGRPANPDAQWQDGALDWFASAIALRPTGEFAGDTPEAIVSRLEGAIARRDFATAQTLLGELPQPMQAAAGDLPNLIAAQAEAAQFLETVRTEALAGGAAQ